MEASCAAEDREKEAVRIIMELSKVLPASVGEDIINMSKKIQQFTLKSKETYEQLKAALDSFNGKELEKVFTYYGSVFLRGSGQEYLTKWEFSDGFLFVEGEPDIVLVLIGAEANSGVTMAPRSLNPRQRWELIKS